MGNDPRQKARTHGVNIKVEEATHGRLRTRNTNISPHVVSDPRQRRRSMSSVAIFTPSRPSFRWVHCESMRAFLVGQKISLLEWYKKLTVNLALGRSHSDDVPDIFLISPSRAACLLRIKTVVFLDCYPATSSELVVQALTVTVCSRRAALLLCHLRCPFQLMFESRMTKRVPRHRFSDGVLLLVFGAPPHSFTSFCWCCREIAKSSFNNVHCHLVLASLLRTRNGDLVVWTFSVENAWCCWRHSCWKLFPSRSHWRPAFTVWRTGERASKTMLFCAFPKSTPCWPVVCCGFCSMVLRSTEQFQWCALHLCYPNSADALDVESSTLKIRRSHGVLRTVISRVCYGEKLKVIRFRMYKECLDRLGDIESGCALVAHHKAIRMRIVSPSSRKATVCTSTRCLTCLLYLVSTWFDPCSQ